VKSGRVGPMLMNGIFRRSGGYTQELSADGWLRNRRPRIRGRRRIFAHIGSPEYQSCLSGDPPAADHPNRAVHSRMRRLLSARAED